MLLTGCAAHRQHPYSVPTQAPPPKPLTQKVQQVFEPPPITPKPAEVTHSYHTVMPQETLWRIGKMYGVPVKTLMEMNQIKDHTNLQVGRTLIIPTVPSYRPPIPMKGDPSRWEYIVVHHTATYDGDAALINKIHKKRGFKHGLGYHFLVDNGTRGRRDGEIEIGHRWHKQMNGAHANKANMNKIGIGIALVGNFSEQDVSEAQLESLAYLIRSLQAYYRIPHSNVIGHRDVPGAATECPGKYFPWSRLKSMIR